MRATVGLRGCGPEQAGRSHLAQQQQQHVEVEERPAQTQQGRRRVGVDEERTAEGEEVHRLAVAAVEEPLQGQAEAPLAVQDDERELAEVCR